MASSDDELRGEERREQQEYEALLNDLKDVIKTNAGKNVLWWVLSQCGIYDTNFSDEDRKTNFLLGRRDIGLGIIGLMQDADPLMYANLQIRMAKDGR